MLHTTNIRMLQKHLNVATFEGSFETNTFVYALIHAHIKVLSRENDCIELDGLLKSSIKGSLICIRSDRTC